MVLITFSHLFPIDGSRIPPAEEEVSKEIEHIISLYRRGFLSEDEIVEAFTGMVRSAELYAYAKGREFGESISKKE